MGWSKLDVPLRIDGEYYIGLGYDDKLDVVCLEARDIPDRISNIQKFVTDIMMEEDPKLLPSLTWRWNNETKEREVTIRLKRKVNHEKT